MSVGIVFVANCSEAATFESDAVSLKSIRNPVDI